MLERGLELSARFVLVRRLGVGGCGQVWLAQDRERGGFAAVKVLSPPLLRDAAAWAALQSEYETLRALEHPHVLTVEGLYRSRRYAWIAMEYAPGGDLSRLRGREAAQVLPAVRAVVSALQAAHAVGVVHRDIKPSNVVFDARGQVRLADFGMAAHLDLASPQPACGSPFSASPQQLAGEAPAVADDIYGVGALLYELLSGYPPFYPDAQAARTAIGPPSALPVGVHPVLTQLVMRMLARVPQARPVDMAEVDHELSVVANEIAARQIPLMHQSPPIKLDPPPLHPPEGEGEPLRSQWQRPQGDSGGRVRPERSGMRMLGNAVIAAGVVGVGLVFFALPRWVEQRQPAPVLVDTSQDESASPTPTAEAPGPVDFAALARAKLAAEEQRAAVDARLQALTTQAADQWATVPYERAGALLAQADASYESREFDTALEQFQQVAAVLDEVEARAPVALAEQLRIGADSLAAGQSSAARAAFELALKIEPGQAQATAGLARANTLDEVLTLLAQARREEQSGALTAAAETFRRALALDGQATPAREGLARIAAQQANDAFSTAMARGYEALSAANHAEARRQFEAARAIRNAPEIAQALTQIEQEQRTANIAAGLQRARQAEEGEQWAEALQQYQAVAALDDTVAAAREGIVRTTPRAALNEQLELYLTQPERLFSQPVREAARETLATAATINSPGPRLQRQTSQLQQWLIRAEQPVQVALQSDNLTQVTIQRVGQLGVFERRSLSLPPGSYTVVGTRPGYRDVRHRFEVRPGMALQPLMVRCEDRI